MSIDPDTEFRSLAEMDIETYDCENCNKGFLAYQSLARHTCADQRDEDGPDVGSARMLCLLQWLEDATEDGSPALFKSKFIADDVGQTARQVGVLMGFVDRHIERFDVEKLAYTSATQWRVTRSEADYWGDDDE